MFHIFQLPLLCGLPFLEKSASQTAHWIAGRSGKHLFLTDTDGGKLPLLLQMVKDSADLHFMLVFNTQQHVISAYRSLAIAVSSFVSSDNFDCICRSALRSFKRRVAYANANYDRILKRVYDPFFL